MMDKRLRLHDYIHPGFGAVRVTKGSETVLYDVHGDVECPVLTAEKMAREDPDHMWRIVVDGPLRGAIYHRRNPGEWVLVESLDGFA